MGVDFGRSISSFCVCGIALQSLHLCRRIAFGVRLGRVRRPIGLRPHHDESSYIKTREMAFCCQFAVYYAFVLCMQKESKDRSFRCGTKHAGVDSSRAY